MDPLIPAGFSFLLTINVANFSTILYFQDSPAGRRICPMVLTREWMRIIKSVTLHQKSKTMTTTTIKKQIHKAIDIVQSEPILKAIHLILNQELKQKKEAMKAFTLDEFYARNSQSQKEIKQDKLIEHRAVKAKYSSK